MSKAIQCGTQLKNRKANMPSTNNMVVLGFIVAQATAHVEILQKKTAVHRALAKVRETAVAMSKEEAINEEFV